MGRFLNYRYSGITPYTPGEQPQNKQYIKLNTNESPYPPSPKAIKAIDGDKLSKLNLYPDPNCSNLVKAIAEVDGVDESNVAVGNGSDEILAFAFLAFCGDDVPAMFPDISYGFYKVFADLCCVQKIIVPLKEDFSIDVKDYFNADATIFIANPNAPTGIALSLDKIEQLLINNPDNLVVIDEAYVDFGADSAVKLIDKYDNLLVVKTFSKAYNLAGARIGYAFANKAIIDDINTIKFSFNPYNINRLSLVLGEESIRDREYFNDCISKIIEARNYTINQLDKRGFKYIDSKSNFVFASHPVIKGEELYQKLKNSGILVRYFNSNRIYNYVRITIGTMEQMKALFNAIDSLEV
ncbi:MAG: histidinol-phosphate transaminase [Christensenellaceae bacterium]|nr:histidinol-phosphate transaminase [Christensenellaceae bacterium]